jgi:hypothetical protein
MWYRLAQNVERAFETLKSKGVSDDTINNLQAMTDIPLRGKYIGALMQNPLMPWDELQSKFQTNQLQKVSNDELRLLADLDTRLSGMNISEEQKANFYKWVENNILPLNKRIKHYSHIGFLLSGLWVQWYYYRMETHLNHMLIVGGFCECESTSPTVIITLDGWWFL